MLPEAQALVDAQAEGAAENECEWNSGARAEQGNSNENDSEE
jgi:hypothetical protein